MVGARGRGLLLRRLGYTEARAGARLTLLQLAASAAQLADQIASSSGSTPEGGGAEAASDSLHSEVAALREIADAKARGVMTREQGGSMLSRASATAALAGEAAPPVTAGAAGTSAPSGADGHG